MVFYCYGRTYAVNPNPITGLDSSESRPHFVCSSSACMCLVVKFCSFVSNPFGRLHWGLLLLTTYSQIFCEP
jgi:hypothetical protein